MPLSLTTFTPDTVISATGIRSRVGEIEDFVNQLIESGDLKTDEPWVRHIHIYKPEFFGSPSPRCEAVSGDTWSRFSGLGVGNSAIFHADPITDAWIAIPGLSATVRNPTDDDIIAECIACFYAFTIAGSEDATQDFNDTLSATFALFAGETRLGGTERFIFATPNLTNPSPLASTNARSMRSNLSMYSDLTLPPGTTSVSVRVQLEPVTYDGGADSGTEPDWKHTFVGARSFVVDAHHLMGG